MQLKGYESSVTLEPVRYEFANPAGDERDQLWVEIAVTAADLDSSANQWDKALSVFPHR